MQQIVTDSAMNRSARITRVQTDLQVVLKEFPRVETGLTILSAKMLLSKKTLKRVLKGSHCPSYQTLLKIYRYLTGSSNDRETILKMPDVLSSEIIKTNENFSITNQKANFSTEVELYLQSDSVFRNIYIETACGEIHKDKVSYEHGQYGIKVLESMSKLNIIKEISPDLFVSSTNRSTLSTDTLHTMSKFLLETKFNQEKSNLDGENFFQIIFDGIDKQSYNDILKIDWEAKNKRIEVLKNSKKGNVKFWTISYTDTLSKSCIYDDNKCEVLQ